MSNVSGALAGIVSDDIRERAVQYWKNIDKKTGDKIEQAVRDARGWPAYLRAGPEPRRGGFGPWRARGPVVVGGETKVIDMPWRDQAACGGEDPKLLFPVGTGGRGLEQRAEA